MIQLRPFHINDFDQLIAWEADEEALMQFAGPSFSFPLTKEQLAGTLQDNRRLAYSIFSEPGNQLIGHAEIYFTDASTALLCRILIGDPQFRSRGLGLQTVNHLLHIAFSHEAVTEASLNVFDFNAPAIRCYTKAGFTINEGKTKTRQLKNKTWTALNMVLTKTSWEHSQKNQAGGSVVL